MPQIDKSKEFPIKDQEAEFEAVAHESESAAAGPPNAEPGPPEPPPGMRPPGQQPPGPRLEPPPAEPPPAEPPPPEPPPHEPPPPPPETPPEPLPRGAESIEQQTLSVEEADNLLNTAAGEYLNRYREYVQAQMELRRERDPQVVLEIRERLHQAEMILNNAQKLYQRALEEYKLALYFDRLRNKKKEYLTDQIRTQRWDIFIQRIRRENPNIGEEELSARAEAMIQQEVERMMDRERNEINREILGIAAYNVLSREENLNTQRLNILREENIRVAGFWGRLWQRYQGLSYGRKALIGAAIAGAGGGILGVLGGAGFAALGMGATLAGRRFFGGFVVGGGVKNIADRLITRREQRRLNEETQRRIDQIRNEIAEIIRHPDKEPKDYETWLRVMGELDKRLNDVLQERENIRQRSDRSRRRWTLIAALIGGVASNVDNIYNSIDRYLFAGRPQTSLVPAEAASSTAPRPAGVGAAGGVGVGPEAAAGGGAAQPELPSAPIETAGLTTAPEVISGVNVTPEVAALAEKIGSATGMSVLVGKGGFWEAAQHLKQMLGLSDAEFVHAWQNSVVTDPISGEIFSLPQAHYVAPMLPDQEASLVYDLEKKVFNAVLTPKVKIGGARELIDAWVKATGNQPPFRVIWSMMRGGSKI